MFEFIETKRHTVESVYGKPEAEILAKISAKYEAVEFRIPTERELCFGPHSWDLYESWGIADEPRLILRRKTVKRRVLTETGEVRMPKDGDMCGNHSGGIFKADTTFPYKCEYPIYRETFVEVEL